MRAGPHHLDADEPKEVGGGERGPDPYELLLMSLGACTSMTLRQYAKRKGYALKDVQVRLRHERAHATDCQECGDRSGQVDHVTRQLLLSGPLSESQRQDLLRIADRCPVHRTLENHPVSSRNNSRTIDCSILCMATCSTATTNRRALTWHARSEGA